MRLFETVAVAFALFSTLPVPLFDWDEENMRYALCAFPLVGAVIGLMCWLWSLPGLPRLLQGAGWTLIPLLVTGGIHLDGFCDAWDARLSAAPPEEKRAVMKDPHLGAQGALRLGAYLLASLALWTALPAYRPAPVLLSFCLSRCLSGLALLRFPLARGSGLAAAFARAAEKRRAGRFLALAAALLSLGLCCFGWPGAGMALAAWACFGLYYRLATRDFGGVSGDLAGWFLQTAEIAMLAALCFLEYWEEVL